MPMERGKPDKKIKDLPNGNYSMRGMRRSGVDPMEIRELLVEKELHPQEILMVQRRGAKTTLFIERWGMGADPDEPLEIDL